MIRKVIKLLRKTIFFLISLKFFPWVIKCLITLDQIIQVLLFSKFNPTIKKIIPDCSKRCYILGNGPSLKENLITNLDFLSSCSLIVVNDMSQSDYFKRLKPEYYVLADPGYWDSHAYNELRNSSMRVLNAILDKTTWPMYLIIPYLAYENENFRSFFNSNKNIVLIYYNSTTFHGFEFLNRFVYKHYLGMPKPQNVLIPCISIAVNFGYKEINLLGVDHSWTQNLFTNNENEVCLIDNHFYDKQKTTPIPMRTGYGDFYKMHQILIAFSLMFEGYHIIRKYANYRNAKIINRTNNSFIDAFERKNVVD